MIKHNGSLYLELDVFWQALHLSFNLAQFQSIDETFLNELDSFSSLSWLEFSGEEFTQAIINCCDFSSSKPDKLSWSYLKCIIKNKVCLKILFLLLTLVLNWGIGLITSRFCQQ